ncbi:glycosyl hydrolase family 12 [Alteromonadaceae bacterium 2753L.S.0a.02]|nr:glycosyl hydrolase family 12 [Alteromonadaceae bacterium 2753L.S.0a.02]
MHNKKLSICAIFCCIALALKVHSETKQLNCEPFSATQTPIGDFQNNVWNQQAAGDFKWRQCVLKKQTSQGTKYGWSWQWPPKGTEVYAQPQVTLGQTPWVGHKTPYPGYPISLASLNSLSVSYQTETNSNGAYNLATTFWITSANNIPTIAHKESIAAELMVWTYASPGFYNHPAGKKVAEMLASGENWEVWVQQNWHDTSGVQNNRWVYIAFRSKSNRFSADYDATAMINFAVERGYLKRNLYIADIQLGNEVMSGTGETWVDKFAVSINGKLARSL